MYKKKKLIKKQPPIPELDDKEILLSGDANNTKTFAIASVIPSNMDDGISYLKEIKAYNDASQKNDIVDICWKLYENEGIIGSTIDTLIDLAITRGTIENVNDEKLKSILNYWSENVNNLISEEEISTLEGAKTSKLAGVNTECGLLSLCENVMLDYLVTGDAVIYENWVTDVEIPEIGTAILPKKIILYDIKNVTVEQNTGQIGSEILKVKVSDEVLTILKDKKDIRYQSVVDSLSPEVLKLIQKGETQIPLPAILTTHFKRKGFGRQYGIPYLKKAFSAISSKRRLQALDEATVAGMIQRLTILMVGHKDPASPYHIATPQRVATLKAALKKLPANKMIIWGGPDLDVIDIGPDGKVLSFENRFKDADDSISLALGVPRILIDGSTSGSSSRDWIVVIKTVSSLERIRAMLKTRIDRWLRYIAVKNNYEDEYPRWRWSVMNLKDERVARTLIMKAYEDGLVGRRTSLNFLGWDAEEIINDQMKEKSEGLNNKIDAPNVSYSSKTGQVGSPAVDNPKNKDKKVEAEFVTAKFEVDNLLAAYNGISVAVSNNMDSDLKNIIVAGFYYYSINVSKYAEAVLRVSIGENKNIDKWVVKIGSWASYYIENFKRDILSYLDKSVWPSQEEEKRSAVVSYLNSQEYRVKMTIDEVKKKAQIASGLMYKEEIGETTIEIIGNGDKCNKCQMLNGKTMGVDEAFDSLPIHPGCTCYFK